VLFGHGNYLNYLQRCALTTAINLPFASDFKAKLLLIDRCNRPNLPKISFQIYLQGRSLLPLMAYPNGSIIKQKLIFISYKTSNSFPKYFYRHFSLRFSKFKAPV
jgi:hypothetical protein